MIILEEHVVRSSYDPLTNTCHYHVEYQGKGYCVSLPKQVLDAHGLGKGHEARRRNTLAAAIAKRLQEPPDYELKDRT